MQSIAAFLRRLTGGHSTVVPATDNTAARATVRAEFNGCRRRGAVAVLAAVLMIVMVGFIAFGVDVGYMMVVKTQLQNAVDSAAMAAAANMSGTQANMQTVAKQFAAYHKAGGTAISLNNTDIQYGLWDANAKSFSSSDSVSNAIKITARRDSTTGSNKTFFARILGTNSFNVSASAIALANPRDICFVVDLSGSMNDDTTTGYGSSASFRDATYTSDYNTMLSQMYSDFGFGTYPSATQTMGQNVGATSWSNLYSSSGPLSHSSVTVGGVTVTIPSAYKILSGDSTSTRQGKAYKWIIDTQIATLMPAAKPAANSSDSASYSYWQAYISSINSNSGVLGYRSYLTWLQDAGGRDQYVAGSQYGQLSVNSPNCPYHTESTAGGNFSFPPSEQPTHAERRSVIAGLNEIKTKNSTISDTNQKDWVSIVTFDKTAGTVVRLGLTSNYDTAMQSCTTMQAVGNGGNSTSTETGLIAAYNLIKAQSQGGTGRENCQKVVILLTDGVANLQSSSNSTISSYRTAHPSSNFYGGTGNYSSDAALMQAATMDSANWHLYALALGIDADYDFMDRMARMGGTADDSGHAPTTSGDPNQYESEMTSLLQEVVDNPQVRLVQ
ncbi:MAG TPA: pilus assembly protein TadG-related protein [Pirellulales bacterium]